MSTEHTPSDRSEPRNVGQSRERREDAHLLRGAARYTDDIQDPRQLFLAVHRSQYGHANLTNIDSSGAERLDGVVAVYTATDLADSGIEMTLPDDDPAYGVAAQRPVLADETVRHQGDPIAAVLATDRYTAAEAADLIEVDYERLDATVDVTAAIEEGAPQLHEHAPGNVAFEWEGGSPDETAAAFEEADHVVELDLDINRVIGVPMEPRGAIARYRPGDGHLSIEASCQHVIMMQDQLSAVLGLPEHKVSVKAPDVGGGFGVKYFTYAEHVLVAWCAIQHERPIKWIATRSEAFQSTNHSRRHHLTARAAVDSESNILGLHVDSLADVGGYLAGGGSFVPAYNVGTRILGAYDVPAAHVEVTGVFTNTTPLSAYRGAGRPEATYIVERLASACARELGLDPVEFRRRNFIPPEAFPYETPFGITYDSGDYEAALDAALDRLDYTELRERQQAARERGRYLGIGLSTYIEICGGSSGEVQGGHVRMLPSGTVVAATSMVENGQGHYTSFAQIVADELGLECEDVEIVEGDTDRVPEGQGTGGSRAVAMGGSALRESAAKIREQARALAARELEASVDDLEFDEGTFRVVGAPSRSITITEIAEAAYDGGLPEELRGLEDVTFFSPGGSTAPFGTHIAVVEVDPDSGEVELVRYVAVDDVGNQINPTLLEGQIVGGIVQSIGQALYEDARYDGNGTLVSGSLQDYALPKAFDVPEIEWGSTVTPTPHNPLGVKGAGEAGTIGATPAIVNAVIDALEPLGVETIDMPMTGERIWQAIEEASG